MIPAISMITWSSASMFAVRYRMVIGAVKLFKIESNPDGSLPVCKACTAHQPLILEHAFSCRHIKIKQHDHVVKQVEQMLVAAGRNAELEVTNSQDTDNTRPAIITENDDTQAGITQTALDFTSTAAYNESNTQLPDRPSKAMERIASDKHAKYQHNMQLRMSPNLFPSRWTTTMQFTRSKLIQRTGQAPVKGTDDNTQGVC